MNSDIFLASAPHAGKLPSPREMAAFDAATIAQGTPSLELMERAGRGVFEELRRRFLSRREAVVTILCGPGNNGGDGLVLARYLHEHHCKVNAVVCCSSRYSPDFGVQAARYLGAGGRLLSFPDELPAELGLPAASEARGGGEFGVVDHPRLAHFLRESDLVVDAILGTGQKSGPRGSLKEAVEITNQIERESGVRVVALDLPTGIDADSGQIYEPAIRADITLTIELIKRGMLQLPARDCCGEIHAVPIGIDCGGDTEFSLLHAAIVNPLPPRPLGAHKGDFGHVLVAGGSRSMPGAPVLAAVAALRTGAGLVTKLQGSDLPPVPFCPELLLSIVESRDGVFEKSAASGLDLERYSAAVLGPGLGAAAPTTDFVLGVIDQAQRQGCPLVIDADALNCIAAHGISGLSLKDVILTPHPGEMARLLGIATTDVQNRRYEVSRELAQKTGAIVVLKGALTVVYAGSRGWVNTSGNPYMATAGSGDVLSGMVAALVAQRYAPLEAARFGVFFHGRAGDMAALKRGGRIIASDIIEAIPLVL